MEQRKHRKGFFIRHLLPMIGILVCMIGYLYACSVPKITFPTDEEIREMVLTYIRQTEFASVTKLAVFEIRDRVSDEKKKSDNMRVDLAFVNNNVYYSRAYSLSLKYDDKWKIDSMLALDADKWTDYPMAGVTQARLLEDLNGMSYTVGGIQYTLSTKEVTVSNVENWENLNENKSGISLTLVRENTTLVHTLEVSGEYQYKSGEGWIRSEDLDIDVMQKITAAIPDEMVSKALDKLHVTYLDQEYNFQELEKVTWTKIKQDTVDHADNRAVVCVLAHGETDLLAVETEVTLVFKYSDGWYFFGIDSYGPEVKVSYLDPEHVISEEKLRETLIANKFRYGYAPDATLTDQNIADLMITDHRILDGGKKQQMTFKYTLVFERAAISIKGESIYSFDEQTRTFLLASRSSTSKIESLSMKGTWYGVIQDSEYVDQYLMLVLDEIDASGTMNGILVYRCVEKNNPEMTPENSTIQGVIRMEGECDIENLLRISLFSVERIVLTKYDTITRISGYFDFAINCIASDVNTDIVFRSEKPEGFPDLESYYQTLLQSGTEAN